MSRVLLVLFVTSGLLASGCTRSASSCQPDTQCPSGGRSFKYCTTIGGSCFYQSGDGSDFTCKACGNCVEANALVLAWCAAGGGTTGGGTTGGGTTGGGTTGGGTTGGGTTGGGTTGGGGDMCTANTSCSRGTYRFCSSSNGTTNCRYNTSDGSIFTCASCNNCNAAASNITAWCNPAQPDLSMPPPLGCNGYLTCTKAATTQAAQDACDARITQQATDLLTALDDCLTGACMVIGDGGTLLCVDPSDSSTRCKNCLNMAVGGGGACASQATDCFNDG